MTDREFKKYQKAKKACKTFLKASDGINTFITDILAFLASGELKKVANRLEKVNKFLNPEDYEEFKNDIFNFKGHFNFDSAELRSKWVDKFVEYFKK